MWATSLLCDLEELVLGLRLKEEVVILLALLGSWDCLPVAPVEWAVHELGQCSVDDLFHDRVLHLVPEVGRLEDFGPNFVVFDFLEYDAIDEVSRELVDFETLLRGQH